MSMDKAKLYLALVHGHFSDGSWLVSSSPTIRELDVSQPFYFVSDTDNRSYKFDPVTRILYYGSNLEHMQPGWRVAGYGTIPKAWEETRDTQYIIRNFLRSGEYLNEPEFTWSVR
jgi:hypothetical protein